MILRIIVLALLPAVVTGQSKFYLINHHIGHKYVKTNKHFIVHVVQ